MHEIARRLEALGHVLPPAAPSTANYLRWRLDGDLLVLAGQIGEPDAAAAIGDDAERLRADARHAALKLLATLDTALDGDESRIGSVLRLGVFVAAGPAFKRHSEVADGASDLVVAVLGERGRHARTAVGVASLPTGAAVEVDAIVRLRAGAR